LPLDYAAEFSVNISAKRRVVVFARNPPKGAPQHLLADYPLRDLDAANVHVWRRGRVGGYQFWAFKVVFVVASSPTECKGYGKA
jgi:hypothetical protein